MKKHPLSDAMKAAIALAEQNGGKLYRHRGGFWSGADWTLHSGKPHANATTVTALVNRKVVVYSDWKHATRKNGSRGTPFPIMVELVVT